MTDAQMTAVHINAHGGPEVVEVGEIPRPQPGPGEVLIRIRAAALNHLDLWVRMGIPGLDPPLPHVLGSDGMGEVAAVGPGVTGVAVGDRVLLNPGVSCRSCRQCRAGEHSLCDRFELLGEHRAGTYAEYAVAPAENVYAVPEGLSDVEAAALPLVFVTAWRMMIARGRLRPGEDVLIIGIGGGVSGAAMQLALMVGARVFATSGSDEKLARATEAGVAGTINHREQKFNRVVREMTGGRGVDMVVDSVGGETWVNSLGALAKNGRLVTCGATAGPRPSTHIQRIFWNQLQVIGSTMGSDRDFTEMLAAVAHSGVRPIVDSTYPLTEAAQALGRLESGEQYGKIVLTVP